MHTEASWFILVLSSLYEIGEKLEVAAWYIFVSDYYMSYHLKKFDAPDRS